VTEVKRDAKNVELPEEELRKLEQTIETSEPEAVEQPEEKTNEEAEHGNG